MESFKRFTEMEDKIKQLENELKWAIIVEMEAVSHVTILLYNYINTNLLVGNRLFFLIIYINYHATYFI